MAHPNFFFLKLILTALLQPFDTFLERLLPVGHFDAIGLLQFGLVEHGFDIPLFVIKDQIVKVSFPNIHYLRTEKPFQDGTNLMSHIFGKLPEISKCCFAFPGHVTRKSLIR